MAQARAHLQAVQQDTADPTLSARRAAARRRGAARPAGAAGSRPGASAGGGGDRPAYNLQFATTTDPARVIVGVQATNRGSDQGLTTPMLDEVERRTGRRPAELLIDGGYTAHDAIDRATAQGTTCYAPLPTPRAGDTRDPHAPRADDSAAVAGWRRRMATDEAKAIYRQRAAAAETVNADAKRHRGLDCFAVRGHPKVQGSAALFALTYNILRLITLTS